MTAPHQPVRVATLPLAHPSSLTLRAIDCTLAGALLVLLAPVLILVAFAIWILSGRRPPFVAHLRVGSYRQQLRIIKFRTMWPRREPRSLEERGWIQSVVSADVQDIKPRLDPRVSSRFAALCRRYSIDELPQLWQVLHGEMSLVGPRPLTDKELVRHYGEDAAEILTVPPGMTGLWQILGRNGLGYPRRRRLDLFLARHYSVGLYVLILLRTIPRVLTGSGAW